ncbi:MAG: AMP-binding protein [Steroidobacteraceae bacterium]
MTTGENTRAVLQHVDGTWSEQELLGKAACLAAQLPNGRYAINLCEDRGNFLLAFVAALQRSHTTLLPAARAVQAVAEVAQLYPDSYRCDDAFVTTALAGDDAPAQPVKRLALASIEPDFEAAIGFTSGSTGTPQAHLKRWRMLANSARINGAAMRAALGAGVDVSNATIVATVPSQHMYGMELTVMLPLLGGVAIHQARPLFAAEIAAALATAPEPRILVSTPVHLRVLLESSLELPSVALIVSATAPLGQALAAQLEDRLRTRLLEMFGATETMVIAARRSARESAWQRYPGVTLTPGIDCTHVDAAWFDQSQKLLDVVELLPDGRFELRGRSADLIEIAGKRASLNDLTRRLLAIDGVVDAVVVQTGSEQDQIRRVAALVVAPTLAPQAISAALAKSVDAVFLPRPLRVVPELPRNAVGKLPRAAVLQALNSAAGNVTRKND